MAKQDIKPLLSFATSNYQSNPKMYVTVAEDKAEEVINVKFKEGSASVEKLENILKNADKLGLCKPLMLFEVMKKLSQPTKSAVLPQMPCCPQNPAPSHRESPQSHRS